MRDVFLYKLYLVWTIFHFHVAAVHKVYDASLMCVLSVGHGQPCFKFIKRLPAEIVYR